MIEKPLALPRTDVKKIRFQRMATGLQIARNQNKPMYFMTLTTAKQRVQRKHFLPDGTHEYIDRTIKESFAILRKRVERAKNKRQKRKKSDGFNGFKFNRYYCLRTSEGNSVLHIVYWGRYIPQKWLSYQWEQIHGAFKVDVQRCKTKHKQVNGLVGYLLQKYLQDQPIERMSYGWKWAWLGFCKSWKKVKETYGKLRKTPYFAGIKPLRSRYIYPAANVNANYQKNHFQGFHNSNHSQSVQAWQKILWLPPPTTRQVKLSGAKSLKWWEPDIPNKRKPGKTDYRRIYTTIGEYANHLLYLKSPLNVKSIW